MEDGLTALQVLDVMSRTLEFAKKEIRSASKPSGKKAAVEAAAEERAEFAPGAAPMPNGRAVIVGRLAEWYQREDLDDVAAAKLVGCHATSVRSWRLGLGDPNPDSMKKIEKVLSKAGL